MHFSNLISITTQDSHESTHQSQSCIKVLCFNLQSCQQIATDIHDMIVDTNADVLMLMETWLYSHGDKAYIAAMTPAGYNFHSFPCVGSRGGGISFVMRTSLSTSLSFKPLDHRSFKAVEIQLSFDHVSVAIVCLYQPPPSKRNKLTNSMFLEEFLDLLSQYADSHSDTVYIGDFNFHYDDCSDGQVSCLRTMFSDHNLTQLVNIPTHKRGHILDWVVVPTENSCFCFDSMQDYPDLSDHKAVICTLAVTKPSPHRHLVTSRNIKAICLSNFQSNVRTWVEAASQQCSDFDLEGLGLRQVLDRHALSITRRMRDRPSAPWMTEEVREAQWRQRLAEQRWRATHLTVHNLRQGVGCCEGVCSGGQETVLL